MKLDFVIISYQSPVTGYQEKVGPGRLELPTSRLSGVRSNQLSYEPVQQLYRRHQAFGFNYKLNKEQQKKPLLKTASGFPKMRP